MAQDPTQQNSRYKRTGKQVGQASAGVTSDCGAKYCITKDNYKSYRFGTADNVGKLIQEINIRLAGFGGNVPTTEFDEEGRTENTIKQFQRDYMGITPTGKICGSLLKAIDEFCEDPKYPSMFEQMICTCIKPHNSPPKGYTACSGFGNGLTESITGVKGVEYPGMHRSIVFIFKAMCFYIDKINYPAKFSHFSSTYRCWADNMDASRHSNKKIRTSSNHMGTALDIQFITKGTNKTYDDIRRDLFCKYMGAPERDNIQRDGFGWVLDHVGLEPKKFNNGDSGATTWVHVDIRKFRKYKDYSFFIRDEKNLIPHSMITLAKSLSLSFICTCNSESGTIALEQNKADYTPLACSHCKVYDKTSKPLERETYYREVGTVMINYMASLNVTNKFKGLYMLAQRRTENGFRLNTPLNNPMNLKMKGDLGRVDLMTNETEKDATGKEVTESTIQSFANFSSEKIGFDTYISQLNKNWHNAYISLFDENKTIHNFTYALQYQGRNGVYATGEPKWGLDAVATYKKEVENNFYNILSTYKEWYKCMLECPNHMNKEAIKQDLILLNRLK